MPIMDFNENDPEVTFHPSLSLHKDFQSIITVVCIIIVTVVGNLTLIAVIFCKRPRHVKRVEIFFVNLAIGNLTVAIIMMTSEIFFIVFGEWVLGKAMCKIIVYLQIVTLASTTFLMTGMSIDRYQMIVKPMESLRSRPKIRMKVITAWVMAFILAIPQLFIFVQVEKTKRDGSTQLKCASKGYTNAWQRKVYFTFLTSCILVIPGMIIFYCYSNIIQVIFSRDKCEAYTYHNSISVNTNRMSNKESRFSSSKKRVVIMVLTVNLGFFVCLTPYSVIALIRIYSNYAIRMRAAANVAKVMYIANSAFNPILYGIFSLRIEHLYKVLNTCLCRIPVENVIERSKSSHSLP